MKNREINREIKLGGIILSAYFIWAVSWFVYAHFLKGSLFSPYNPIANIKIELLPPFSTIFLDQINSFFLLGTDLYGRSLFEILSTGLNYSLSVGLFVSLTSATIGIIIGYLSVKGGKNVQFISGLLTNLIFIFPSILIAIMVMSITGQSVIGLISVLIITGWPGYSKIARGETKRIMALTYVESAKAIGIGEVKLFLSIILPSILPFLLVHIVLGISGVIISEASLGFLGLGGSEYSWGALLSDGKSVLLEAPHMVIVLSLAMAGLIIGLNLLGDGLRDYFDPKNQKELN